MMRLILTTIILSTLAQALRAETPTDTIQISPVPEIYVGGTGLLCKSQENETEYLLVTRNLRRLGIAEFDADDIKYDKLEIDEKTPNLLVFDSFFSTAKVYRKSLKVEIRKFNQSSIKYLSCNDSSVSEVHNAAEQKLRDLLNGNKI